MTHFDHLHRIDRYSADWAKSYYVSHIILANHNRKKPKQHTTINTNIILGNSDVLLWPPCIADADIIFLPCGFFFFFLLLQQRLYSKLCTRHFVFPRRPPVRSFFFPRLISAVEDWMHTILHTWCGLSANLGCRSETCCKRLAVNTGRKKREKLAIYAPSHNFVGPYLHH